MAEWWWRVLTLIRCLIIPFLFMIRRSLAETEVFLARKRHLSIPEILHSLAHNWRVVLLGMMLVTMTTVSFYMITAYTPTFGNSLLHLPSKYNLLVILCFAISNFFFL